MPRQSVLESLDQQWFIVRVLHHLLTVHLQVNHRVPLPVVFLKLWDLELGRHGHIGELGHAGEVRVLERAQALHEPDFLFQVVNLATQLGIFPLRFRWRWLPWWHWRPRWRAHVDARMFFWYFVIGVLVVIFYPVFILYISFHHQVHEI